jgi:hypothetical protein
MGQHSGQLPHQPRWGFGGTSPKFAGEVGTANEGGAAGAKRRDDFIGAEARACGQRHRMA